jgi:DNA-directed RNA polymerase specialized sigma24 family protein
MDSTGSVTHWISALKAGDAAAAQKLWERYFRRLVGLARKRLRMARRRAADEEDVALSALDSFFRGARQGRFPKLADRDDLWQLLVVITARKAIDLRERERRLKRGGGKVRGESVFPDGSGSGEAGLEQVVGPEPSPDFAAQVAENFQRLLDMLPDEELRAIAVWKMESHTNEEIAALLGCKVPRVERRLRLIRKHWKKEQGI